MLLPVVACCVVVSVVGSGFVVVFKGMRKAAQQTPDGFPKGETLHRMYKQRKDYSFLALCSWKALCAAFSCSRRSCSHIAL